MQTLNIPEGKPRDYEKELSLDLGIITTAIDEIELNVRRISDVLNTEQKQIDYYLSLLQQLDPISEVDNDFSDLKNAHYLYSVLGILPAENVERLHTSLARIPFALVPLKESNNKAIIWLSGLRKNQDVLERAVRSAYLTPISIPEDFNGTPAQIILSINSKIAESKLKIEKINQELTQAKQAFQEKLTSYLWTIRSSRMMVDAIVRYGRLKYTYIIVGWIYTSRIQSITQKIAQVSKETLLETFPINRFEAAHDTPIALNNPGIFNPFQMLVTTYGEPQYSELDPTPLTTILFPLMYGAMFGDVGHGLILTLIGWLVASRRVKMLRSLARLGPIIITCGIVSIIFGLLYGSFLGYEDILPAIWIRPGNNIMTILIITIAGGVVVLSIGFLLNIFNLLKTREWGRLFFSSNGVSGLLLYWSLIGFGASKLVPNFPLPSIIFIIPLVIGALGVMFAEVLNHLIEGHHPLIEGGIGTYIVQIIFEILETLISYLSNSLSFVRIGAFAVAHGNLSAVFFLLAAMVDPGKGIGYWLVFLVGLIFIVGFEGLIVGIQTMRLTYYEFFGKFFTGGGKRFEPLTLRPTENE
jgi:V/A-type H+/Na+-transporting ATPase subunit I